MAVSTNDRSRSMPGAGLIPGTERALWYFLRISGLLLVVFALTHLFVTHYLNVPSQTVSSFVADRWANPLWRTFDIVLLYAAVWHGMVGMRMIVTDMINSKMGRQITYAIIAIVGIVFTVMGTVTVFTFDPDDKGPFNDAFWIGDAVGYSLFVFAALIYIATVLLIVWVVQNLRNDQVPVYRGDLGQYAWILHRATGAGIVFFLLVHIFDIMLIGLGKDVYDHTVSFYANWFIVPMEIILVGAVIYHTLNGIRVLMINFTESGPVKEARAFWWVLIATIILTIPSGIVILIHEL